MGTVRIVAADSTAWQPVHEAVAPAVAARMSRAGEYQLHYPR